MDQSSSSHRTVGSVAVSGLVLGRPNVCVPASLQFSQYHDWADSLRKRFSFSKTCQPKVVQRAIAMSEYDFLDRQIRTVLLQALRSKFLLRRTQEVEILQPTGIYKPGVLAGQREKLVRDTGHPYTDKSNPNETVTAWPCKIMEDGQMKMVMVHPCQLRPVLTRPNANVTNPVPPDSVFFASNESTINRCRLLRRGDSVITLDHSRRQVMVNDIQLMVLIDESLCVFNYLKVRDVQYAEPKEEIDSNLLLTLARWIGADRTTTAIPFIEASSSWWEQHPDQNPFVDNRQGPPGRAKVVVALNKGPSIDDSSETSGHQGDVSAIKGSAQNSMDNGRSDDGKTAETFGTGLDITVRKPNSGRLRKNDTTAADDALDGAVVMPTTKCSRLTVATAFSDGVNQGTTAIGYQNSSGIDTTVVDGKTVGKESDDVSDGIAKTSSILRSADAVSGCYKKKSVTFHPLLLDPVLLATFPLESPPVPLENTVPPDKNLDHSVAEPFAVDGNDSSSTGAGVMPKTFARCFPSREESQQRNSTDLSLGFNFFPTTSDYTDHSGVGTVQLLDQCKEAVANLLDNVSKVPSNDRCMLKSSLLDVPRKVNSMVPNLQNEGAQSPLLLGSNSQRIFTDELLKRCQCLTETAEEALGSVKILLEDTKKGRKDLVKEIEIITLSATAAIRKMNTSLIFERELFKMDDGRLNEAVSKIIDDLEAMIHNLTIRFPGQLKRERPFVDYQGPRNKIFRSSSVDDKLLSCNTSTVEIGYTANLGAEQQIRSSATVETSTVSANDELPNSEFNDTSNVESVQQLPTTVDKGHVTTNCEIDVDMQAEARPVKGPDCVDALLTGIGTSVPEPSLSVVLNTSSNEESCVPSSIISDVSISSISSIDQELDSHAFEQQHMRTVQRFPRTGRTSPDSDIVKPIALKNVTEKTVKVLLPTITVPNLLSPLHFPFGISDRQPDVSNEVANTSGVSTHVDGKDESTDVIGSVCDDDDLFRPTENQYVTMTVTDSLLQPSMFKRSWGDDTLPVQFLFKNDFVVIPMFGQKIGLEMSGVTIDPNASYFVKLQHIKLYCTEVLQYIFEWKEGIFKSEPNPDIGDSLEEFLDHQPLPLSPILRHYMHKFTIPDTPLLLDCFRVFVRWQQMKHQRNVAKLEQQVSGFNKWHLS